MCVTNQYEFITNEHMIKNMVVCYTVAQRLVFIYRKAFSGEKIDTSNDTNHLSSRYMIIIKLSRLDQLALYMYFVSLYVLAAILNIIVYLVF